MNLGFIIPHHPNEKRVALLPEHIKNFDNKIVIESGYGKTLEISDEDYVKAGCRVLSRSEVFKQCEAIFSMKFLFQPDYQYLRKGHIIIGWINVNGAASNFMREQGNPKELVIVHLDNIRPTVFYKDKAISIDWIESNFAYKNSFIAGFSSALHGIMSYGIIPNSDTKIAVLGSGNVSQGAFNAFSKFNADIRMFYRKTIPEFKKQLRNFDIILNGIEVDNPDIHILSLEDQKRLKKGCLLIETSAMPGKAIEGSRLTTFSEPIYEVDGIYYYSVNNAPSIFYRESSRYISESFSKNVYCKDVQIYFDMIKQI